MTTQTGAAAISVVVLWSSAFVAVAIALTEIPPGPLAFGRYAIASVVMVPLMLWRGIAIPSKDDLGRLMLAGAIGIALYNLALNAGQQTVSPGVSSLLVNTAPIWTALLSLALLGEAMDRRGWIGTSLSFVGVSMIGLQKGGWVGFEAGVLLVLAASCSLALYFVIIKPPLERHSPLEVTAWAIWFGTLFLIPFARDFVTLAKGSSDRVLAAVVFLGVGPAALAYLAWSYVLSQLPAGRASGILFLIPVSAIVIAWGVLGTLPSSAALGGGTLSVFGVFIARGFHPPQANGALGRLSTRESL